MNKEKVYKFKCKRLHNNYLINVLFKLLIKIFRIQIIFIAFSLIADHSPDQTGAYHGYTFSELCSSFIGGMMHELGHAFGILTHTYRYQVVNQEALMGTGYIYTRGNFRPDLFYLEYTRLSYGSALILNSSHYFNRDLQITGNPIVSAEILNDGIPVNGHRQIKFTASDPDGLGAAILQ